MARLAEHVDLLTGFPFKSADYSDDQDAIPLVRGDNVVQGRLRWDNAARWPEELLDGLEPYFLEEGDVVLAMDRPWIQAGLKYAKMNGSDTPSLLVQRVARLRAREGLDQLYLYYLIGSRAFTDHVLAVQTGTAVPHISGKQILEFEFERPNLAEQRRIACILGSLDDKIEHNRRTAQALERLARAIFKAWFVDFEPVKAKAEGATSFPSMPQDVFDALPTTFVDTEIGPVPEGWGVKALPDAFDINPKRTLKKGDVAPYLGMSDMPTTGHAPESWAHREYGSGMRFVNGDTLVARITPCLENGKTAFVDFLSDGEIGWGSTEYIVLRPKKPLPDVFAYCLARTREFREFAIQNMTGTSGRQRVSASALDHYLIAVPDAATAGGFEDVVGPMFEWVRASMEESRKLARLRDYLLPMLTTSPMKVVPR